MSNREERPLVQQESLRLNSDTFWFTVFHEIGHIMKFMKRAFSFLDWKKCLILFQNGNYSVMNSGISFPEPHATYSGLKSEDFGSVFCFLGTFSAHSLLWLLSLNSGKWAVSNTFLTGALEKTGCHFLGKQLLSLHIQVPVNVCGHLNISVAHVLLHIFQGAAAVEKQACAAMP